MKSLFKTSQSKVKSFRQCKKLFQYKHIDKIQRKKRPRPLAFGTIVHKMKESVAAKRDPFKVLKELPQKDLVLFREERETYGDIINDIKYIFSAYLDFYKDKPLIYLKRKGGSNMLTEHPFELQYPKEDLLIKGTIDAATANRKMDWLTEHKNHGKIPNDDERWRNVQSVVYIQVSRLLGWWDFEGTCWDYIRTKPPTKPQLLKNGELSRRALDSLPQVVLDTIKEYKLNPKDYQDVIDEQKNNMTTWFQRVYTPVKKEVLKLVWIDFLTTSAEMRDTNFDKPQPRTIGWHCNSCEFEPLCRAALTGSDEEFLKERYYEASTYGDEESPATKDAA